MKLQGRKLAFRLQRLCLATGLLVFSAVLNQAGQDSEETGSRGNVGRPPSNGEEGERTSPEAPGGLTFGGRLGQVGLQKRSPFTVGIVEANGNLVPVATFNGWSWSSPDLVRDWKRGGESLGEWTLWYENPGPSPKYPWMWTDRLSPVRIGIATTGLVGSEMLCSRNLALATDAGDRRKSLIECDHCCPDPKRGIATTAESSPGLVERLEPKGEASRRMTAMVLDTFNELENQAFERTPYSYGTVEGKLTYMEPWRDVEKRQKIPLGVRRILRIQEANSTLYYLELIRDFPIRPEVYFPANSFLQAWVRNTGDELVWITQSLSLTNADMKGNPSDTPIVFWRRGDVVALLVRRTGWESEDYLILTIKNDGVDESASMSFR